MFLKRWTAAALCLALSAGAAAAQHPLKTTATGNPQIKSVDAIAFAPQGVLLIGDGQGRQIVAVDTKDTKPITWTKTDVNNIDGALAARVGTTAKGIEIVKLAVNPASQKAYFAVRKMDDKSSLLLTLDGNGKVGEFALDNVKHSRIALPGGEGANVTKVTDVAWAGDRVLVAAQASDKFASKIFAVPAPLENGAKGVVASTRTYHVAHGRWETNAPIRTVIPFEVGGKKYLVGAFTCTPVVKYGLDDLEPNGKVEGTSVIELGSGNTPLDMFTYQKDGKTYILMNTVRFFHAKSPVGPSKYWTAVVDQDILNETEKVNEKATQRIDRNRKPATDRARVAEAFHGVVHMDILDRQRAVVIREDGKGVLSLTTLALP
jgi:hypothetical protein